MQRISMVSEPSILVFRLFSQSLYTRSQSPGFSRDANSNFGYPSMYRGKRFLVCTESVDVCVFACGEFQFRICMYRVNRYLRVLVMWIPPPQYDFFLMDWHALCSQMMCGIPLCFLLRISRSAASNVVCIIGQLCMGATEATLVIGCRFIYCARTCILIGFRAQLMMYCCLLCVTYV